MNKALRIRIAFGFILVSIFAVTTLNRSRYTYHPASQGETMGTMYSFRLSGKVLTKTFEHLCRVIETDLTLVNQQMSTWDPNSEISQFNAFRQTDPFSISGPFALVTASALKLSHDTGGAFDPTLNPLLNLWGFGSQRREKVTVPSDEAIAETLQLTGWKHLQISSTNHLQKHIPNLELDLSAIAKGYGVDVIAERIRSTLSNDFYIEIGGEVIAQGFNPDNQPWRIGIQSPSTNPLEQTLQGVLHITHQAIATSGDYRNYIQKEDRIYSHILDPRTGQALHSDLASVTVSAPSCMQADGMATALYVMGPIEGVQWVEQHPDVEALFLTRRPDGTIFEIFSSGFRKTTGYTGNL